MCALDGFGSFAQFRSVLSGKERSRVPSCPRCSTYPVLRDFRLVCPHCGFEGARVVNDEVRVRDWVRRVRKADFRSRRTVWRPFAG